MMELIFLVVMIAFTVLFVNIMNQKKLQQDLQESALKLETGDYTITPAEFLEMRNISFGGRGSPKYINNFKFAGVYIIYNHTKRLHYIGQGQNVFDRIYSQFVGNGNQYLFGDYKYGDYFTIRAISLYSSNSLSIESLKKQTVDEYNSFSTSYSKITRDKKLDKPKNLLPEVMPAYFEINRIPRYSVTSRIDAVQQPHGGYINPSSFTKTEFNDGNILFEENIYPNIMGLVVDYLTRYMLGASPEEAFRISVQGASNVGLEAEALHLVSKINGLSEVSINKACQLCGFDVAYHEGAAKYTKPYYEINPDYETINNIRTLVNRSVLLFEIYGPIISSGFVFEGGYTSTVTRGEGDYLTSDTLWDMKISKAEPNSKHTLQLLMYYIMGCHSVHQEFKQIEYLGIFNPRLNAMYRYKLSELSPEIVSEVERNIIGYGSDHFTEQLSGSAFTSTMRL